MARQTKKEAPPPAAAETPAGTSVEQHVAGAGLSKMASAAFYQVTGWLPDRVVSAEVFEAALKKFHETPALGGR